MTRNSTILLSLCVLILLIFGLFASPVSGRGVPVGTVVTTEVATSAPSPQVTMTTFVEVTTTSGPVTTQAPVNITETVPQTIQTAVATTVPPSAPVQTTTTASPVPVEIVIGGIGIALILTIRARRK